jgi:hypothetical protein
MTLALLQDALTLAGTVRELPPAFDNRGDLRSALQALCSVGANLDARQARDVATLMIEFGTVDQAKVRSTHVACIFLLAFFKERWCCCSMTDLRSLCFQYRASCRL